MQYLLTKDEQIRIQVIAAIAEAEGFGEVMATDSFERLRESLGTGDVSCVLIDEGLSDISALAVVQDIARSYPLIPVVLLSRSRTAEVLTAAMDAGARTVLTLPLSLEELSTRLQPVLAWSQAVQNEASAHTDLSSRRLGSVTAVVGAKGGVGASTVALMTAAQLAQHARTCLVDLDVRGGDIAAMTGLSVRRSITDLVDIAVEASAREISEVMYPLPGGIALLPAPDHGEMGEAMTEVATRQIISMLRYQFDHVVLDCGSRLDDVLAMALDSADRVLVVTTPDTPAVRSVRRLTEALNRLDIARGRPMSLVVNRSGRKREIQPKTAARMAAIPLAIAVPDLTSQMEMAVNSNTLLTAKLPALIKATHYIAKTILAETVGTTGSIAPEPRGEAQRQPPQPRPQQPQRRRARRWRGRSEKGQVTVEFPVVFALATAALLLCVQLLGYGVSYMLANHAAEEAARDYGIGMSTEEVHQDVAKHLPDAYGSSMTITRTPDDRVTVTLPVPSAMRLHTSAEAGIVWEAQS
jgi:putative septum site-determining protein